MAKMIPTIILLFSVGCLQTRSDIKEAEQKQLMRSQVIHLQKDRANSNNQFQSLQGDMREFNGRMEVVEHTVELFKREAKLTKTEVDQNTLILNQRVSVLEQALGTADQQITALKREIENLKKKQPRQPKPKRKGPFRTAEDLFTKKKWKKAILNFQKYVESWPKGRYVPLATYKIGVCFQELGMPSEAKVFFDEVITKYPNTKQARSSSYRLKNLKKRKKK